MWGKAGREPGPEKLASIGLRSRAGVEQVRATATTRLSGNMRILHSIRSVNPHGGGPIEAVKQFAGVNRAQGHEVEVVSLDDPAAEWVKTFPLKCHALGPSRGSYGYSAKLVPWLRENAARFDAVIVDGLWQYHAFAVWRALRRGSTQAGGVAGAAGGSVPYFVFTHGMLDPWFKRTYPLKHLKKWLYWPWGDYRVLRDAQAVLFTCEEERRLARESFWLYRCNERVVNFGTGAPTGDAAQQRELFLNRFPALRGKHTLLFLGRVHVKKAPDLLLNALADVLRRRAAETADWHLVMAGPDEHAYAIEMKNLAASLGLADRVTWTGMLTGDMKWGAFRAASVFVLPSHQENFGIAVAEGLACRLPVLISNKVNIWREIETDGAGLVANDDLPETTRLLERWLDLPENEKAVMAKQAGQCFAQRFDVAQSARALIEALSGR